MKKLFVLALLSIAFNAMATDQYIYWMVDDNATLDGQKLEEDTYYAKIKAVTETGSSYLNFYTSPDAGVNYGEWATIDTSFNMPMFAGTLPESTTSFIVELYNTQSTAAGSWVGQATFGLNASNIASGGMGTPPGGWALASSFTAVPEPTSGMLLLLGVAGLALRRKNKKA